MNLPNDPRDDAPSTHVDGPDDGPPALRALRVDALPGRDLWPGIANRIDTRIGTRIETAPAASPSSTPFAMHARTPQTHRRRRRFVAFAAAASVALAIGVVWQLWQPAAPVAGHGVFASEAERMTREYRTAWTALDRQRRPDVDASALHQIDRSAAQVRAALQRDPDARFLFDRLQSLYARRLDLAQRLASDPLAS